MSEQQRFGKHWLRMEADGLVFLKYHGTLLLTEIQQLAELIAPMAKEQQDLYMLFDLSESTTIEPAARKYCMKWLAEGNFAGAANFGGGLLTRTTGEMLLSALRLLHKLALPTTFVKTEAEARAWIAEQRLLRAVKQR